MIRYLKACALCTVMVVGLSALVVFDKVTRRARAAARCDRAGAHVKVGDRVVVTAMWSTFHTMKGRITQLEPHLMIIIDHDKYPIRVGAQEIALVESEAVT